ncbi:MAG: Rho termination factor [Flavobacterium circumlabens]|uniref:Rho termination factor n=1 Tax=Flavobacterium circumlabens TaxID=2133765 RepID=A0A4Y7UGT4_9FLAO|nr:MULTISPECIES: Rho termination factor [Flavobacterium]QSB25690.1 Rho termination factor [Flavobacterium sp. CLA17]TCN59810.1 hypothetical protein EV142_102430 [Flavobacterium circumlabens]TEB45069.1 Rho termination factor [Flavobacterium circumlabens]
MPDPVIKNEEQDQAHLKKGNSEEKSVSIDNTPDSEVRGGRTKIYEEWTKDELYQQAKKVGIPGRSYMSKKNLIKSLRNN